MTAAFIAKEASQAQHQQQQNETAFRARSHEHLTAPPLNLFTPARGEASKSASALNSSLSSDQSMTPAVIPRFNSPSSFESDSSEESLAPNSNPKKTTETNQTARTKARRVAIVEIEDRPEVSKITQDLEKYFPGISRKLARQTGSLYYDDHAGPHHNSNRPNPGRQRSTPPSSGPWSVPASPAFHALFPSKPFSSSAPSSPIKPAVPEKQACAASPTMGFVPEEPEEQAVVETMSSFESPATAVSFGSMQNDAADQPSDMTATENSFSDSSDYVDSSDDEYSPPNGWKFPPILELSNAPLFSNRNSARPSNDSSISTATAASSSAASDSSEQAPAAVLLSEVRERIVAAIQFAAESRERQFSQQRLLVVSARGQCQTKKQTEDPPRRGAVVASTSRSHRLVLDTTSSSSQPSTLSATFGSETSSDMTEDEVASVEKVPGTDIFVASAHTTDDGSIIDWYQGERIGRGSFDVGANGGKANVCRFKAVFASTSHWGKRGSQSNRPHVLAVAPPGSVDAGVESKDRDPRLLAIEKELKLLQMLDSPFTVKLLGFEAKPIQVNIFLEYCDGGSIASCLSLAGAFPPELTLKLLSQISLGLEYLHDKGIIHRDIKGANVLLTMEGHAKIGDFGISKHLQTNLPYNRASRMSRQGTAQWMAPEVLLHPTHGYSAKVDIWSLGCVAIEMATAQPPWSTEKNFAARLSANHAPPIPNSAAPAVAEFIRSCLELDPNLRPTASQLLLHDSLRAVDPWDVHFREWYEPAKARRQAAIAALGVDEDDEVDEDDDDDDSDG